MTSDNKIMDEKTLAELSGHPTLLKTVVDSLGDGVIVADKSGKFLVWNDAASRILGLGAEDLDMDEWSDYYGIFQTDCKTPFPSEDLPLYQALSGTSTDHVEMFVRNSLLKDGAYLSVTGRPLLDPDGVLWGGVVAFHDITHRVVLSQKLEQQASDLERHNRVLQQMALYDKLTGIPNRRYFDRALQEEIDASFRQRSTLSLLLLDIDFFKKYNDTMGHIAGDDCLKHFVQVVQEAPLGISSFIARFGGEEFAVILPDHDKEQASEVAEQILVRLRSQKIPYKNGIDGILTASIGVGTLNYPYPDNAAKTLLTKADAALYKAKHEGRNQVKAEQ